MFYANLNELTLHSKSNPNVSAILCIWASIMKEGNHHVSYVTLAGVTVNSKGQNIDCSSSGHSWG